MEQSPEAIKKKAAVDLIDYEDEQFEQRLRETVKSQDTRDLPTGKMAQVFYKDRAVETPNDTLNQQPLSADKQDEANRLFLKTNNTI